MFGIGFSELIVLALVVIVLLGPDQLPTILRTVTKLIHQFSKAKRDVQRVVSTDESIKDIRESVHHIRSNIETQTKPMREAIEKELSEIKKDAGESHDAK